MNGRGWLAGAALTLGLAASVPATALAGWSAPAFPITGVGNAPDIAVGARGDVALVAPAIAGGVLVATRAPGGAFAPPTPLGGATFAPQARIAINAAGDVAVAWITATAIHLAVRPHGAAFRPALDIPAVLGSSYDRIHVGIDDAGAVALGWQAVSGGKTLAQFAIVSPDGTLGTVGGSAGGQSVSSVFDLAMNAAGDAIVSWVRTDGTNYLAQAAVRAPGASAFGTPVTLSQTGVNATDPSVALAPDGSSAVAWELADAGGNRSQVSYRPRDGLFSLPTFASPTGLTSSYPAIALAGDGDVVTSWTGPGGNAATRTGAFGSAFSGPASQFDTGGGTTGVAAAAGGHAVVVYANNANTTLYASSRAPGGGFDAPVPVAPGVAAYYANYLVTPVAMDAAGDAAATWQGAANTVGVSLLDVTPPELRSLAVPAAGTAGTAAAFAVDPADAFSAIASTSWSFGDGTPAASGTSVQHAFAAAGSYDVTVTSTDVEGNTASATRTVAVAAAPVVPPPIVKGPPPVTATVRCAVPSLKDLTSARAKAKLVRAHCTLGKVTTPKRLKHEKGLVVRSQSRKAGTRTTRGAKVNVTLGTRPKPKKAKKKSSGR
ncbi:MAG: domain containing protein [Conexibacter sp.]|nr:domain containing protein [Conexibacter sp.]